jgi:hypothetical protein
MATGSIRKRRGRDFMSRSSLQNAGKAIDTKISK